MILFKKFHIEPIKAGTKISTRRKGKKRWREGSIHQCYTKLPFSKGGAIPFAPVRIERVYEQSLGEMTEQDAKKEGGYTLDEFRKRWAEMHGFWNPTETVWVVEFHLAR